MMDLFDIVKTWVEANYRKRSKLIVERYENGNQIRINILPGINKPSRSGLIDRTMSHSVVALCEIKKPMQPNTIYYRTEHIEYDDTRQFWRTIKVSPHDEDFFDQLRVAIDVGLINIKKHKYYIKKARQKNAKIK